ncbi:hypothetical protein TraAM80_02214 [Trypanosoma rangeli]|uniref:Nucleotide-diphospho-sugar transferase domain-containing protein n=1 Tax=Trypanosoma rangeli TaxID=5698 RepID=A0A3R7NP68_TRYRA|nr:uncharacterized protein TraAM80_02214 [Trypanosoma rangeli]RNF09340.1 hypothetical protein TraAM80_02214 [Trypanosoma rangeli]|eukprot:RNF09340.1 hypothetical protein TraAM80_02214 [Trypanosoma rangeli]
MTAAAAGAAETAISCVCTMGTPECDDELYLFLRCLRVYHPGLPVVVGCTATMLKAGKAPRSKAYAGFCDDRCIEWVPCLDPYVPINRSEMEQRRGVWYPSRHADFMMEKANLMEHAMARRPAHGGDCTEAVLFLDCDVVLLGELPRLPQGTEVALSSHRISCQDEALFGRYNGGFVAAASPLVLHEWRRATRHSRYFDQASLESVAQRFASKLYEIPPQHNYGYWRFFQPCRGDPLMEARRFSLRRAGARGELALCYEGEPLRSIHTHFLRAMDPSARDVSAFNGLMKKWILRCIRGTLHPGTVAPRTGAAAVMVAGNARYQQCFDLSLLTETR